MLDSVVDGVPSTKSAEDRQRARNSADEVYEQFAKLCDTAGPTACKLAGHPGQTTAQRVDQLLEKLRSGTIPAPHANPPGELGYGDVLVSSFAALRDPALWPAWAEKLNAAADGDGSGLLTDGRLSRSPKAFAEATKSSAISCLDGPAGLPVSAWPTLIPELVQHQRWQGTITAWWLWAPCAANWPAKGNDRYAGPWNAKADNPVLLINGRYDPNTGYQNAVNVSRQLGNAVLLTLDGYGHVTSHDTSACIEKARTAYIVDLVLPPPGTVCAADHKPFGLS
jgi:pimeloyl-ACP methyl ester carboxylesterase